MSESALLLCRRVEDRLELLADRLFAIGGMMSRVVGVARAAGKKEGMV